MVREWEGFKGTVVPRELVPLLAVKDVLVSFGRASFLPPTLCFFFSKSFGGAFRFTFISERGIQRLLLIASEKLTALNASSPKLHRQLH